MANNVNMQAVAVTTAWQKVLDTNSARKYCMVQNLDAAGTLLVNTNPTAADAASIKLAPGAVLQFDGVAPLYLWLKGSVALAAVVAQA